MVSLDFATKANFPTNFFKTSQIINQADGQSRLEACGEVQVQLNLGKLNFKLHAVVVSKLDCDVLAGMPFLKDHRMILNIPNNEICIGKEVIHYETKRKCNATTTVNATSASDANPDSSSHQPHHELLRSDADYMIHPGEYAAFRVSGFEQDSEVSVEPHCTNSSRMMWPPPMFIRVVNGMVYIPNQSEEPIVLKKDAHIAVIRRTKLVKPTTNLAKASTKVRPAPIVTGPHSANISVDPDVQLSADQRERFVNLHMKYDGIFNPTIGRYNDHSGRLRASINIGKVEPPTVKARLPDYDDDTMHRLQEKSDELEELGVLAKPEDVDVVVEHVNPSFLVTKPEGGERYVTSFVGIAGFAKPPPSRVTTCESVLRFLAKWKYVIKTDMTKQFFQMLLRKASMKYCGVITPFKGLRVYTRAVMGMPGSTEHLDELTFRVLGDLIHEGSVSKIADDLYVGASNIDNLLVSWERVLQKFMDNNLRLSARKTIICPVSCTILGWQWSQGSVSPSAHKLNPLSTATPPTTVKGLRSWIGAVKHLKPCIPQYSSILSPLESAVGGKESRDRLQWTTDLTSSFEAAKLALHNLKPIFYPKPTDQLVITTDAASSNGGIGSVLFIIRDGETKLGGYFSLKMKSFQLNWLPCEQEALAITSSINHWKIFIKNSRLKTQILTDSKPCVQAFIKLTRGEFSQSNRIVTFLSALSLYNISLQHISGTSNELSDYLSRNPAECNLDHEHCQICSFTKEQMSATVLSISVSDVIERKVAMPFTSPLAWRSTQQECPDMRRAYAMLRQGTKPSHKQCKSKDTRSYRSIATISNEGLLVVKKDIPYLGTHNLTIIPRSVLPGLLTALHLRLSHPSKGQLSKAFHRHFYALDAEKQIEYITKECSHCSALQTMPADLPEFSTSYPPQAPGFKFASDVLCRSRQKILVTRDTFSSFTKAYIIEKEDKDCLRAALIESTSDLRITESSSIRVDGGPAFQSLVDDKTLSSLGIELEVGRLKNKNKNPVAEKAIRELETELRSRHPEGGKISRAELATAVHILNSRIRNRGLSAREIVYQRDQASGKQLNMNDEELAESQFQQRRENHAPSALCKKHKSGSTIAQSFKPGDLVYCKQDGSKHVKRERYIVISCDDDFVYARKFAGNQFRTRRYSFKPIELYKVPNISLDRASDPPRPYPRASMDSSESSDSSDEEENFYHGNVIENAPPVVDITEPAIPEPDLLNLPIANRKQRRNVGKPDRYRDPDFIYPNP